LGIILGGFTKGKEKEGLTNMKVGELGIVILTSGKLAQRRVPKGKGEISMDCLRRKKS